MNDIVTIGDHVRIAAIPNSPRLTIVSLYLEGEKLYASCSWKRGVQEIAFPLGELVLA